ncbi:MULTISPECIES: hypothetical protein [unclassified Streptomyces]|uniref:hypothetical protein n=1 Tax=unclassified Streptomyces TaxID=2593676 RepID=UPI002ED4B9AD|nr:hypothetical protein OH827_28025 [Streptomyces sp. NBC_00891]WSY08634.1 hypothetical protein OG464_28025 [Streptomyces sp. NBC_00890]WSZ10257.1 hypothetical protein OG704_28030 [Streptomyces sp. NBC_00869]WSZ22240.1 hypothetical protein OG498_05540 [Streptomyces sp. NBC_00870]
MTNSLTTPMATARALKLVLEYAGLDFEVEEGPAPGGCRLRLAPSVVHPWTHGDVQAHLLAEGITAEVEHLAPAPRPGHGLVLTLPSEQEVQDLGRLLETRLTEAQNSALQLHRALARIGVERRVEIQDVGSRSVIDLGMFDTAAAALLYRSLSGDESVLRALDLVDWHDHERFARELERAIAATGQVLSVESVPTCGHCRGRRGGNRIHLDYLNADDALLLADALRRNTASAGSVRPSS